MSESDWVDLISGNLDRVQKRISAALERAGRTAGKVSLIAVTKTLPPEAVRAALACGLTEIGENRVQEAQAKVAEIPEANWHLIGHLQTNKVKLAASLFDSFQAIDSVRVAEKLSRAVTELGKEVTVLAQVNTSGEESKFGLDPASVEEFFTRVQKLPGLQWSGLMTIGPFTDDAEAVRSAFSDLRQLCEKMKNVFPELPLAELSMGMSDDFEIALEEGATILRLGRILFGERE